MAEPYKIVIGLEVHVQLLTKTKLFCGCLNKFGLPPNSATCPVCLGLPGSLPVMNEQAFRLALRAALALNCTIASHAGQQPGFTKWDRKNYYYPDLPKNFQISQYDLPFSHDGWLEIHVGAANPDRKGGGGYTKKVGIIRAHLEEDAGKNLHDESGRGADTLVDLNRTGTPLLEIVSHPDMNSAEEAVAYLEEIRLLLREIGVSDCEMQEGSLRCDANVNVLIPLPTKAHPTVITSAPYVIAATSIVEIKNLNSFRAVGRAIAYEAKRQYEQYMALLSPEQIVAYRKLVDTFPPEQMELTLKMLKQLKSLFDSDPVAFPPVRGGKATRGWDDAKGCTVPQRDKEESADYRYFPEPDLVPVVVSKELIEQVKAETGELPSVQRSRLQRQYGLSGYDAQVLTAKGRKTVAYFETVAKAVGDGKAAANRMSDLVYPALAERKEEIEAFPMAAAKFAEFLRGAPANSQDRREVFKLMLDKGVGIAEAMILVGIKDVDEMALRAATVAAIAANPKAVADFKKGKDAAKMSIVGAVMKANKGVPNDLVRRLVDEELAKV